MAICKNNFLRGIVGPVIFKNYNGEQHVVSKMQPGTMRQTENTRKAQGTFGMGSTNMHNRLAGVFQRCLTVARDSISRLFTFEEGSFDKLVDFDFNSKSKLGKRLQIKPKSTLDNGMLALRFANHQLPGKLLFMKGSTSYAMTVSLLLIRLHDGLKLRMPARQMLKIEKSAPDLNGLEFLFEVPDGCLCIASVCLKDCKNEALLNTKACSPGAICGVYVKPRIFPALMISGIRHRSMLNLIKVSGKSLSRFFPIDLVNNTAAGNYTRAAVLVFLYFGC